jgi:hypothetical protein
LMGLRPDDQVAMLLHTSEQAVRNRRHELRISRPPSLRKVSPPKPWGTQDIALLGTASDAQVARRFVRSITSVKAKRSRLRISLQKDGS